MWVKKGLMFLLAHLSPAMEPGSELDIWHPAPWPTEHTDSEGKVLAYMERGRFQNPWMNARPSVASFFLSWYTGPDEAIIPGSAELGKILPVKPPVFVSEPNYTASNARMTWLGHATTLAEVDGHAILTDPVFSARASAVQFVGPKRYTAAACKVKELPPLSAVLVSHNHYDHLDLRSVARLAELQPNISWFVPSGMAKWLIDNTVVSSQRVKEMTWWQEEQLEGTDIKIVFTPANHWCKRSIADENQMLWGSFAVIGPSKRFWFGGDTGYCEAFKKIGEKYGPFDIAAIPIGAYQPNWIMKYQHVHPGEAVEIHKDIGSKKSLGIHWGTFQLTTENYLEPPALLNTFLNKSGLEGSQFVTTDIGGTVEG